MSIVPHTIIREKRKTILLHITPDAKLVVKAPRLIPKIFIDRFIEEKKTWIEEKLQKMQRRPQLPVRQYAEGGIFLFLGKELNLTFTTGIEIVVRGEKLYVPQALQFRIKKELETWYIKQAKEVILTRLKFHAERMHAEYKNVLFSDTKSKWGTCFPDNSLQFNWRLIMSPLLVIDYVIIHELTHTTEKNHSRSFWNKVRLFTPAYRQHREWLNAHGHTLHI